MERLPSCDVVGEDSQRTRRYRNTYGLARHGEN